MAAGSFYFTNPEAARQAIAEMQAGAAAAENQSRERIARENTASNRYATQSQIAAADKDRDVRKEDLALRRDIISANAKLDNDATRDFATKTRAKVQFDFVMGSIRDSANNGDPHTPRELEALLAQAPDLTKDQKKAARVLRESAVKAQKSLFDVGDQAAKNYQTQLKSKKPGDLTIDAIYEKMAKDPKIIFDRATGSVRSAFRAPREDVQLNQSSILGATRPGGFFPSASEMQAAGRNAPSAGRVTPIAEFQARVGRPVATEVGLPGLRVSDLMGPPAQSVSPQFALPPAYGVPGELYGPPRVSDLQGLRPDLIPMDDYYYPPQ